ncbi:hypothetical protein [Streptomyces sp. NPDC056660]|uniref:hypothetical protein n=1 Tax=Streptomyces sp. NPDC056660 TaxID=3345897 RepID=UPI0036BAE682
MADKLRHTGQGGQSSKARHKTQGRNKLLEEQMKKLQERRHRHRYPVGSRECRSERFSHALAWAFPVRELASYALRR